jgi:hypothetical protein
MKQRTLSHWIEAAEARAVCQLASENPTSAVLRRSLEAPLHPSKAKKPPRRLARLTPTRRSQSAA